MTESNNQTQVVERRPARAPVPMGSRGIVLQDLEGLWRFASILHDSGLAPKALDSIPKIAVAIEFGLEVGLTPMQAVQNIAVINGRPSLFGAAVPAICRATGQVEVWEEYYTAGGQHTERTSYPGLDKWPDDYTAVCTIRRAGLKLLTRTFSVADAKQARLWGKKGRQGEDTPWITYPARMLRARALGFCAADTFPDALKGLMTEAEAADIPPEPALRVQRSVAHLDRPAPPPADDVPVLTHSPAADTPARAAASADQLAEVRRLGKALGHAGDGETLEFGGYDPRWAPLDEMPAEAAAVLINGLEVELKRRREAGDI